MTTAICGDIKATRQEIVAAPCWYNSRLPEGNTRLIVVGDDSLHAIPPLSPRLEAEVASGDRDWAALHGSALSNTEAAHTTSKRRAIHAIAIVEEDAWRHPVADHFDHAWGGPLGRRMLSEVDGHDLAALVPEDHEFVEHLEPETDDSEEGTRALESATRIDHGAACHSGLVSSRAKE
jgi:hypothetical protein